MADASAKAIIAAGASLLHGDLDDLDSLNVGAAESDGVIHLAFGHDFTAFEKSIAQEGRAVQTFGAAL